MGKKLKNLLFHKSTPDFIFDYYFSWKNNKERGNLMALWKKHKGEFWEGIPKAQQDYWKPRIDDVMAGPDNDFIPRINQAGELVDGQLMMHNGLKVDPLSYYDLPMLEMLRLNKGVHEPQEERIFQEVLPSIAPKGIPTMMELGSYWSFYSMWFKQQFPNADCYMAEPNRMNLFYGKRNFQMNGFEGTFQHCGIGKKDDSRKNIRTIDSLCKEHNIEFLDILHSDIQGYEFDMLEGSSRMLSENRIGYVFISTHSNSLHSDCMELLENQYGFHLVASANLEETFSWDGIMVMKSPFYQGVAKVDIALKKKG